MVGVLTSYFDFLTYPIVTLGFPLCAFFLLNGNASAGKGGNFRQSRQAAKEGIPKGVGNGGVLKDTVRRVVGYSICWGIGYAGMWAMKWIIADLTLHTGTIRDAVWSIIGRTEAIGGRPRLNGGFYVIGLNLLEYDHVIYPVMAGVIALASLALVVTACRKKGTAAVLTGLVPYLIIFCMPFVWIIVVQHHSALHARFTFRILAVAVLAVGCMGIKALETMMKK